MKEGGGAQRLACLQQLHVYTNLRGNVAKVREEEHVCLRNAIYSFPNTFTTACMCVYLCIREIVVSKIIILASIIYIYFFFLKGGTLGFYVFHKHIQPPQFSAL